MRNTFVVLVLALLLLPAAAFTHGGKTHLMGTVAAADAKRIAVNDDSGRSVSIRLTPDTLYYNGNGRGSGDDIADGRRVMVDAFGMPGDFSALEIRIEVEPQADNPSSEHRN